MIREIKVVIGTTDEYNEKDFKTKINNLIAEQGEGNYLISYEDIRLV